MMNLDEMIIKNNDSIRIESGAIIMHAWETPIMARMAEFICQDGGDILEVGFGMGISARLIQKHDIKSHDIVEIHPDIFKDLEEWSKDKNDINTLFGDWWGARDWLKTYDGILFDTYLDKHVPEFKNLIPTICNDECKVTWWNNLPKDYNEHQLAGVEFEILHVQPPVNDYFNHKTFHMPKYIHNEI